MSLEEAVTAIADAIVQVDRSRVPFRGFQPGVGPYGEPQLVKLIAVYLNGISGLSGTVSTKRTPDLLIRHHWAMEIKIVRPFGDNGREAEDWSVNLLHPYPGNVSSIGDCWKLEPLQCAERKAAVVIGYEHTPPKINLTPLVECFETIAKNVAHIQLSDRVEVRRGGLVHPVHQAVRVLAWEIGSGVSTGG
jgi:hypothetical protein